MRSLWGCLLAAGISLPAWASGVPPRGGGSARGQASSAASGAGEVYDGSRGSGKAGAVKGNNGDGKGGRLGKPEKEKKPETRPNIVFRPGPSSASSASSSSASTAPSGSMGFGWYNAAVYGGAALWGLGVALAAGATFGGAILAGLMVAALVGLLFN